MYSSDKMAGTVIWQVAEVNIYMHVVNTCFLKFHLCVHLTKLVINGLEITCILMIFDGIGAFPKRCFLPVVFFCVEILFKNHLYYIDISRKNSRERLPDLRI